MGIVWLLGLLQAFFLLHSNESLMLIIFSRAALYCKCRKYFWVLQFHIFQYLSQIYLP